MSTYDIRKRPLRTYSKRTVSGETAEPASKRQRTEKTTHKSLPQNTLAESSVDTITPPTSSPTPSRPASGPKRTITSYFKVVPSPTRSEPTSKCVALVSTPPSSPSAAESKQRKPRRLKTRVSSRDTEDGDEEAGDMKAPGGRKVQSTAAGEGILTDSKPTTANRGKATSRNSSRPGQRGRDGDQDNKTANVQTTLTLSLSEKGFTECKECNMLFNPFHENDAKYHARRHAALRKAKSSKGGALD
ncbi:hypothetical protein F4778DRAFT_58890 [Xylariomycetidae sp. FL2044]|nr:hypothetical protein F4778DRAFT_58890 [Xylariomycetidae sp. FL2044]